MTQITKLFEKCLNLHKNYKYVEEKENLKNLLNLVWMKF